MTSAVSVIASYNEAASIRGLLERILLLGGGIDVVVADDNSPDGTGIIAEEIASRSRAIHVIHRPRVEGLGPALSEAFSWALDRGYEKIVNLDGDFSHNPGDIPLLLANVEDSDLAIGSRYVNGIRVLNWRARRLALSLTAAFVIRTVTRMPIWDPTSGFRCFRKRALSEALRDPPVSKGYSIHIELLHRVWRAKMRICEVPIIFTDRTNGSSKMNTGIIFEALWRTFCLGCGSSVPRGRGAARSKARRRGTQNDSDGHLSTERRTNCVMKGLQSDPHHIAVTPRPVEG
jgi:dolichol-phosphate mannosyltransferase